MPSGQPVPATIALPAWPRYRDNLARHLIGIARDVQLRLMGHLLSERSYLGLRPSFGVPISLVAQAPRPVSELARALAISAQAASQLVGLAEQAGYLARTRDPEDRRARRVVLTEAGERLVRDAANHLRAIGAEHARRVGASDYQRFESALAKLVASLELTPRPSGRAALPGLGRAPAAGLLPILSTHVEQSLMRTTSQRGHTGLKLSHGQILTLIGPSGARLHRLAELHRVSRQAISATARDLEALDIVARDGDPADRRGVIVRLTDRGRKLIEDSVEALDALERDWRKRIDAAEFDALEQVARRLYEALALETEILRDAFAPTTPGPLPAAELARIASRLRDRLGSEDAARLAARLAANA